MTACLILHLAVFASLKIRIWRKRAITIMTCCCRGGFCELVLPNDNSFSVLDTTNAAAATILTKKGASSTLSKRKKRLQNSLERERIIGLLKWVLTTEEYARLEETGDLVRLRANKSQGNTTTVSGSDNYHNQCGFWIDAGSVDLAKKEHRPNLARLAFTEYQSSGSSDHQCDSDGGSVLNITISVPSTAGNEGDVAVCGICFNVYTLLKQARKLLASQHRVTKDQDETTTCLDVRQESGNNQPASIAANDPPDGKGGALTKKLSKASGKGPTNSSQRDSPSSNKQASSSAPGLGPISPQHKLRDNDNLMSKRKEKQRKRDRNKLEKNSKIHILVAETDEVCIVMVMLYGTDSQILWITTKTYWPSSFQQTTSNLVEQILVKEGYTVDFVSNVEDCLQTLKNKTYSILVLNENLSGKDDELIALRVRQDDASSNRRVKMRILVLVQNILSVNYHSYDEAEVNGFLPMPLEAAKLVSSIRKAVSHYSESALRAERKRIADAKHIVVAEDATNKDKNCPKSLKPTETKHAKSAASSSIKGISTKPKKKEPIAFESRFQYDEKTSFPYTILENCSGEPTNQSSEGRQPLWCNLLVCHDVFDTYERFKIFFLPMVARYPGMKILLWNYPGQAFTSFTDDANLNNRYHADCLSKLLEHLRDTDKGKLFMDERFFILAHGSGAAIATFFAANQRSTNLSGMILVNGLSHVDSHFASIFHDCRNVFSCSPESRPDLPVYFYARFLFSPSYLSKTTSSLALNVYTAVHNPITLNGRNRLCQGVLNHVDTRPMLKDIGSPIISIHGEHATLVRAIHSNEFLSGRQSCSTIHQALKGGSRTAIVMMKGGHELFQEKKYHMSLLVEQILTGFHEKVRVQQQSIMDLEAFQGGSNDFHLSEAKFEDVFINKVVQGGRANQTSWDRYQNEIMADHESNLKNTSLLRKTLLDEENKIKASEAKNNADGYDNPEVKEVKEYMAWRIKRQKKRLALMEHSAIVIQCALRSYMAKTLKLRLKKHRAATRIQCYTRGVISRDICQRKKKELCAAMLVQRATRGHLGRCTAFHKRLEVSAQTVLARMIRGAAARRKFQAVLTKREHSASKIQCIYRMHVAIALKKIHRSRRVAATSIQRCYRGRLGRKSAAAEREQYMFSRNQLSGIESGRQILSEHKLLAMNLQSDLFLLNQEKEKLERKIEFHSTEITYFERNVSELETKMHLIFNGDLVCASESVVREEKRRINEEITDATANIFDRKAKLEALHQSLEQLLRDRQGKLERSKDLEAKLAVLLVAQVAALEGVLDKKTHRVEHLLSSNTVPIVRDQVSDLHRQSPVPPISTNELQTSHSIVLENDDSSIEHIPKNQIQLVEHRLSPVAPPFACKQPLRTPKIDKTPPVKQHASIALQHSPAPTISNAHSIGSEDARNHTHCGPSEKDKLQAAQLIDSTETMLKFGFMSMSLTYFSTLNMMRAMQKVAVSDALSTSTDHGEGFANTAVNIPVMHSRKLDKDSTVRVESWSINDVSNWLASVSLSQYQPAFKEGAVDGAFLCELTDEDLRNTLGVEHRLHRKKILFSIRCLKNYSDAPTIQCPTDTFPVIPSRRITASESIGIAMSPNSTMYDDNSTIDAANVGRQSNNEHSSRESLMKSHGKLTSLRDVLTPTNAESARYLDQGYILDAKSPNKANSARDAMTPTKSDKVRDLLLYLSSGRQVFSHFYFSPRVIVFQAYKSQMQL